MIKLLKVIGIIIGAIVSIIISIYIILNYPIYLESRAKVHKYVNENYTDIRYMELFSVIGWNTITGRHPDYFHFWDKTNNRKFLIYCDHGRIVDDYAFDFVKEKIENKAKELFPNNDLDYSISGRGLRSTSVDEPYGLMYCHLIVDERDTNDTSKIHRLVSVMNDEFVGMDLTLSFSPILQNRSDLSSYGYYRKYLKLTGGTFMSEEEFMKFMAEETPKE